jgi:hypothetical protein
MYSKRICKILITLSVIVFILTGCGDDEYILHLTIEGKGTISLNDNEYDNSTTVIYEESNVVTVKYSNSYDDWEFEEYTGDLTGTSSSIKLTMDSDKNVTATFSLENSVEINGRVTDTNSVALPDVTVTSGSGTNQVTAVTDSNGEYSMSNVPVPSSKRVYLVFKKDGFADQSYYFDKERSEMTLEEIQLLREYNLFVQNNSYNFGSLAPTPETYTFTENYVKTLSASHNNTLTFVKWTGDVPSTENVLSDSISITMDKNRTITAAFLQLTTYTIQVKQNYADYGTVLQTPEGITQVAGSIILLSNTPEDGYVFSHWLDDNGQISDSATLAITLNENAEYTCIFNKKSYQLTIEPTGEGQCYIAPVSDTMLYLKDTLVTLKAIPAKGWLFRQWQGSSSGTNKEVVIVMDSDKTMIPVFEVPNATFLGQVHDENNIGLPDVKVIAGNESTRTKEDGTFWLDNASITENADTMIIVFQKPGYCIHSEMYQVHDQIEIQVYPQLSKTCHMLALIIQTLQVLSGQTSDVISFDIDANNQPNLSEVIFMLVHMAQ